MMLRTAKHSKQIIKPSKNLIDHTKRDDLTKDSKKLALIMKRHFLSQEKVARIVNVSQPTVSLWFKARRQIPKKYFDMLAAKGFK